MLSGAAEWAFIGVRELAQACDEARLLVDRRGGATTT
jgi:hypothetical protein